MQSANVSQSNIFNKIDDRKMYGLTGKVVEARYSDGTLMKFDKTGKLIRLMVRSLLIRIVVNICWNKVL